jgi:hypothetical protein
MLIAPQNLGSKIINFILSLFKHLATENVLLTNKFNSLKKLILQEKSIMQNLENEKLS